MIKHVIENLPAALAGAFLSGLLFYWVFWVSGILAENPLHITIGTKGHTECYQSISTSLP